MINMNSKLSIFTNACLTLYMLIALQGCSTQPHIVNDQTTSAQTDPEAAYQHGMQYGLAKEPDNEKAFLLLRRAAQQGHLQATYALAWLYLDGRGTPRNPEQAAKLFTVAAHKGHADSQYMLSVLYAQGRGLPIDKAASFYWLQQSAMNGQPEAKKSLGTVQLSPQSITSKP
jgi:TPR repeat protein